MKALFWIGIVAMVLGVVSLFVPIPHEDHEGIKAGNVQLGMTVQHDEKVSPIISAVLIVGGAGLMMAGKGKA